MNVRVDRIAAVVAGVLVAACGGTNNGDASSERAATTDDVTTTVSTTTPTTATSTSVAPTTAPVIVAPTTPPVTAVDALEQPRFVVTALDSRPDEHGWRLPAGSWQSAAFDPTLSFDTATDLTLIAQSPEAILLAAPGGGRDARLTILVPLAVGGDDNVPIAVPDDFEEYIRSVETIDLETVERFEREDGVEAIWADFVAHEPPGHPKFSCSIGPDCLWVMRTHAGEDVHVIEGAPIRVVGTAIDGVPLRVVASASDQATFDVLAEEAVRIVSSFAVGVGTPPESGRNFLASLGSRDDVIPPGVYVARVGDQVVEFDVADELVSIAVDHIGSNTILFDVNGLGTVSLVQPTAYVNPSAPQIGGPPSEGDALSDPPRIVDEVDAWMRQMFVVTDMQTTTFAGRDATSWDKLIDTTVDSYECGPPMQDAIGGRCVTMFQSELGWWYQPESDAGDDDVGAEYYIADTGVFVGASPSDAAAYDRFITLAQPLLDSITFAD